MLLGRDGSSSTRRQGRHWNGQFWLAVATLVGSTVGVGFYGIPFVFQKAGWTVGLVFFGLVVGLVLLVNLLYGEIVLRTHYRHQIVGYVNRYLGPWAKRVNLFIFWLSTYGALIAIIIISGDFLNNLLSGWFSLSPAAFSTMFLLAAMVLVLAGVRTLSRYDFLMMLLFGAMVVLIGAVGIRHVSLANYSFSLTDYWFLPFGVVLFAMHASGVPLMRQVLDGQEEKLRRAIIYGTLLPAVLYLVFTILVVGVSGEVTSPDAVSGLQSFLGTRIVVLGSLFGFLTTTTIFFNIATALRESLREDFHIRRRWAWLAVLVPPYLLFLSGIRNFIDIISLVGGVAVSLQLALLIFVYAKAKRNGERIPEYSIRLPRIALYGLLLLFFAGTAYTILVK